MFAEVLAVLQILLNGIEQLAGAPAKRRRVAKHLLRAYVAIDSILERGQRILLLLEGNAETQASSADLIPALQAQERALLDLTAALAHPSISALLSIHLPDFKPVQCYIRPKVERIRFYLAELTDEDSPGAKEDRPPGGSRIGDWRRVPLSFAVNKRRRTALEEPRDLQITVIASDEQLEAAREALAGIAESQETLRQFLVDRFELEELV